MPGSVLAQRMKKQETQTQSKWAGQANTVTVSQDGVTNVDKGSPGVLRKEHLRKVLS